MTAAVAPARLSADFWKYWSGQTVNNLGSSFTQFALPLLVYKLTGSAVNLALTTAAAFLPYRPPNWPRASLPSPWRSGARRDR
jgi:hypothetical protein